MSKVPVLPPSGFRDFTPAETAARLQMITAITEIYQAHGFQPISMPVVENLATLQGKGGGTDNEKLIFKILKRGEELERSRESNELADMGLRFDLTLPLARYYARFKEQLPKPFKVFQIGPVWRADRPQKGRYREFIQCDVDIVGSKEIGAEIECISAIMQAFHFFGIENIEVVVNDRRLLLAIGQKIGCPAELWQKALVILDKLDKIGLEGVEKEWTKIALDTAQITQLKNIIADHSSGTSLEPESKNSLDKIVAVLNSVKPHASYSVKIDPTLVRGQDYYTGTIFEIRHSAMAGSLGGGGRYNRLLEVFGSPDTPAFGGSIGFERLALILSEQQAATMDSGPHVFFPLFSEELRGPITEIAAKVRGKKLRADVFPDVAKLKNQFRYADERKVPFVAILGEEEWKNRTIKLKDMAKRTEQEIPLDNFIDTLETLCRP